MLLVLLGTTGCGQLLDIGDLTDRTADAGSDGSMVVTYAGAIHGLDEVPVGGATVAIEEIPALATTTTSDGSFSLSVPTGTPLTTVITAPGHVKTITQTVVFDADSSDSLFHVVTTTNYEYLKTFAPVPSGAGVMEVHVVTVGSCSYVGAHLSTTPPSGAVFYTQFDQALNPSYTALQAESANAFIIGVSGNVVPTVTDVTPCSQAPWPLQRGGVTVQGSMTVEDGAYLEATVLVK